MPEQPEEQLKEIVEWKRDCSGTEKHLLECQGCEDVCIFTRDEFVKFFTEEKQRVLGEQKVDLIRHLEGLLDEGKWKGFISLNSVDILIRNLKSQTKEEV